MNPSILLEKTENNNIKGQQNALNDFFKISIPDITKKISASDKNCISSTLNRFQQDIQQNLNDLKFVLNSPDKIPQFIDHVKNNIGSLKNPFNVLTQGIEQLKINLVPKFIVQISYNNENFSENQKNEKKQSKLNFEIEKSKIPSPTEKNGFLEENKYENEINEIFQNMCADKKPKSISKEIKNTPLKNVEIQKNDQPNQSNPQTQNIQKVNESNNIQQSATAFDYESFKFQKEGQKFKSKNQNNNKEAHDGINTTNNMDSNTKINNLAQNKNLLFYFNSKSNDKQNHVNIESEEEKNGHINDSSSENKKKCVDLIKIEEDDDCCNLPKENLNLDSSLKRKNDHELSELQEDFLKDKKIKNKKFDK